MNQQNRLQPRSYYDVLGVDKTASTEDIKRRFHILSLMLHPDKTNGVTKEQFQLIQEAWEVLKDPQKRCKYDMNLESSQKIHQFDMVHISEEIDLDDMEYKPDLKEFWSLCRCGWYYIISEEQLECNINIVQCRGCSLYVKVLYDERNLSGDAK